VGLYRTQADQEGGAIYRLSDPIDHGGPLRRAAGPTFRSVMPRRCVGLLSSGSDEIRGTVPPAQAGVLLAPACVFYEVNPRKLIVNSD
jgi:hypothetical protein